MSYFLRNYEWLQTFTPGSLLIILSQHFKTLEPLLLVTKENKTKRKKKNQKYICFVCLLCFVLKCSSSYVCCLHALSGHRDYFIITLFFSLSSLLPVFLPSFLSFFPHSRFYCPPGPSSNYSTSHTSCPPLCLHKDVPSSSPPDQTSKHPGASNLSRG